MFSSVWTKAVVVAATISTFSLTLGFGGAEHVQGASQSISGIASIYDRSSGKKTASGEELQEGSLTAAHRTLPFGTVVEVTNKRNGHKAVVRINDRGPFVDGRIIDLTPAGARALGFLGITDVSVAVISSPSK
jgi:rare lipoprotein A